MWLSGRAAVSPGHGLCSIRRTETKTVKEEKGRRGENKPGVAGGSRLEPRHSGGSHHHKAEEASLGYRVETLSHKTNNEEEEERGCNGNPLKKDCALEGGSEYICPKDVWLCCCFKNKTCYTAYVSGRS